MQGSIVSATATKNMAGVVSIGDTIEVESVLYDKDTIIVNEMWRYPSRESGLPNKPVKVADAVIAPKGSYKCCYIHNRTTGKSYPSITFGYAHLHTWLNKN